MEVTYKKSTIRDLKIIYEDFTDVDDVYNLFGKEYISLDEFIQERKFIYVILINKQVVGYFKLKEYYNNFFKLSGVFLSYYLLKQYRGKGIMKNYLLYFASKQMQKCFRQKFYYASVYVNNIKSLSIFIENDRLMPGIEIVKKNKKVILFKIYYQINK